MAMINCHNGNTKGTIMAIMAMIRARMAMIMATLAITMAILIARMAIILAIHGNDLGHKWP